MWLFESENTRSVKKLEKIAKKIEDKAEEYKAKTDEELKETTNILKGRLDAGEKLIDILPDAYACVREASERVIGLRHYHVQLLGAIALFQGRIAEMRTGEGKTLVETMPAYLVALEGKGVHIVTVNEYLTARDAEWMGKIFKFLGLTVGLSLSGMKPEEKRAAYACDITYSTNNELGFDYLRDNMVTRKEQRVCRGYHFAIIDEVDSILIDEARTPLIISGLGMKNGDEYTKAAKFARSLRENDYELDEREKVARLTEEGVAKAERFFGVENLSDSENIELNHRIRNAMQAQFVMKRDGNYIVKDGKVVIVDEFTGRLMEGRQYSNGLHQAIEAKEGVQIKEENKTLATITFQNFFRLYHKISGMTGTAKTEELEFNKIYNLDVVTIPTNKPLIRKDYPDVIFTTEDGKMRNIIQEIVRVHKTGRPILVGTVTIEKNELLSDLLRREKIKHNVLNAKNHQQESEIIAQAGRLGQVTIATNMAGRGTDILLGGNPEFMAKQKLREEGYNEAQIDFCTSFVETDNEELKGIRDKYHQYYQDFKKITDKEKEEVVELGGLHIIGTERHESRRIDNQLRGRAGRQGDPGSTVFYVSMDDELMRRFGGDRIKSIMRFFKIGDDEAFQIRMFSKQIERAQKRIEGFNFSIRRSTLMYDDVLNKQRNIIYDQRNKLIDGEEDIHAEIVDMVNEFAVNTIESILGNTPSEQWNAEDINNALDARLFTTDHNLLKQEDLEQMERPEVVSEVAQEALRIYEDRCAAIKEKGIDPANVERSILLRAVDVNWMNHIDDMTILRNEIGLQRYGQHDPLVAYKEQGFEMFDAMIGRIREDVANAMLHVNIEVKNPEPQKKIVMIDNKTEKTSAKSNKIVGRNDPCPCGSGKKYKNCCGRQ